MYSRAIRVNHEYLADNGVIGSSSDIKDYADKLINYISCKRNVPLTSGFNPSLTRKRLIMLTKSKSGMINYGARIFITLNLAAALLLVLSFTPSYSNPITIDQNMKVFSDKKAEKAEKAEKNTSEIQKVEKLIIVDGVVYTKKLDDIPVKSIQNISVLGNFQATKKYGEKGRNGVIEITTKGKPPVPTDIKKSETPNAEPNVNVNGVAAATKMNVLYLGIANPIEIAVPGVTSDKVSATITNGTINRTTSGWEVKPSSLNDLVLTILVDNKKVNEKKFRVKPIPSPVAVFAHKSNGTVSKRCINNRNT